jgi:RNA polymerase sigma-70 factor (ECF subfamily)
VSDVTPLRPENEPEDPFEALLDEESDEDFGYVVTRDRASSGDSHPVKLAEWKAQDFASIYTRFRPHLERHARRFLNNQSQVDEVVQDAFLYLMVSLPELDSEIGVLRFLKWKTRLLCLDVIRASGKAYITNIDDVAEPVSTDPEVSAALEQQDDAAVIRLAMSKLNPRHREVLLASMYEEKTTLQIAEQVGLSENATRQLVFRARSAFKKALLGDDVNTDGMSAAAILSVAARKAAAEAKKAGAQAMVFALFMVLAVGAVFNFSREDSQTLVSADSSDSQSSINTVPSVAPGPSQSVVDNQATPDISIALPLDAPESAGPAKPTMDLETPTANETPEPVESPFTESALEPIFEPQPETTAFFSLASVAQDIAVRQPFVVVASQGVMAEFSFASDSKEPFSDVKLTFAIEDSQFFTNPYSNEMYHVKGPDGLDHYIYFGVVSDLTDQNGQLLGESGLTGSLVRLELVVNPVEGAMLGSILTVLSE